MHLVLRPANVAHTLWTAVEMNYGRAVGGRDRFEGKIAGSYPATCGHRWWMPSDHRATAPRSDRPSAQPAPVWRHLPAWCLCLVQAGDARLVLAACAAYRPGADALADQHPLCHGDLL